jgi:hypothetical protein
MTIPQPVWAISILILGVVCAVIGYTLPGDVVSRQAMFTAANSLISGGLGAFAGHLTNSSNSSGPNATINNPGSPFPDNK